MNIMVEIKTPVPVVEKNYEAFKWLCLNEKIVLHCSGWLYGEYIWNYLVFKLDY